VIVSTPISPKFDNEPQVYRKPRADVFTALLVVALLAILFATWVLWLVMGTYNYKIKGGPSAARNESAPFANVAGTGHRRAALVGVPFANVAGTLRVPSAGYGTRSVPTTLHPGTDAPSPV
jgi:hypothetical protein